MVPFRGADVGPTGALCGWTRRSSDTRRRTCSGDEGIDMLRRLGIRAKVMAVLAVPMVVLLVAGAYISVGALGEWRYARTVDDAVSVLQRYGLLVAAVQDERVAALGGASPEDTAKARALTDSTIRQVQPLTDGLDLSGFSGTVVRQRDAVRTAYQELLPQARQRADAGEQRTLVERTYADVVSAQLGFVEQLGQTLENRELGAYIAAYGQVARLEDELVQERVRGDELLRDQAGTPDEVAALASQGAVTESARERARSVVAALGSDDLRLPAGDPTSVFTNMRAHLQQPDGRGIALVEPALWEAAFETQLTGLDNLNTQILDAAHRSAAAAANDARNRAVVTLGVVVLAAAASLVLALLVARRIVVPLRRLTAAASQVREELPRLVEQVAVPGEGPQVSLAAIPVESRDEVGRLASAFNAVNATTVQVAQEQAALRGSIAEMFVNVARRDQALLNRQLSFIDSLERTEEDPAALANLFRLDHLATRMRRNAESLLVLAGIDSGRRPREPMPLSDVIRTASSEIEQYERVELDLRVDPQMLGFHALAAAHLLAELLENATIFSEPEHPVVVSTAVSGESVVVRVLDRGLGMSAEELAAANGKIASTSPSDALGVQRLGLFVVGRLARRVGADVRLAPGPDRVGTEAVVRFPVGMFVAADLAPFLQQPDETDTGAVAEVHPAVALTAGAAGPVAPAGPVTSGMTSPALDSPSVTGSPRGPALDPAPAGAGPEGVGVGAGDEAELGTWVDEETVQGLPRRRRAGAAPGAPVIGGAPVVGSVPAAGSAAVAGAGVTASAGPVPGAAPVAGGVPVAGAERVVTAAGLPTRGPAVPDERIVLPETPAVPTSLAGGDGGWAPPLMAPQAGGLPSRSRATASEQAGGAIGAVPPGATATDAVPVGEPVTPQTRTGLFSGFRGRGSLDAAAAAAGAAGVAATEGVTEADGPVQPSALVIPQLAPDDDEWAPYEPSVEAGAGNGAGYEGGAYGAAHADHSTAYRAEATVDGADEHARAGAAAGDGTYPEHAADRADDAVVADVPGPDPVADTYPVAEAYSVGPAPIGAATADGTPSWSPAAGDDDVAAPRQDPPDVPFERTLDEERAWRQTGAIPIVPDPAAQTDAAAQAGGERAASAWNGARAWSSPPEPMSVVPAAQDEGASVVAAAQAEVVPVEATARDEAAEPSAPRSWVPQVEGWTAAPRFDAPPAVPPHAAEAAPPASWAPVQVPAVAPQGFATASPDPTATPHDAPAAAPQWADPDAPVVPSWEPTTAVLPPVPADPAFASPALGPASPAPVSADAGPAFTGAGLSNPGGGALTAPGLAAPGGSSVDVGPAADRASSAPVPGAEPRRRRWSLFGRRSAARQPSSERSVGAAASVVPVSTPPASGGTASAIAPPATVAGGPFPAQPPAAQWAAAEPMTGHLVTGQPATSHPATAAWTTAQAATGQPPAAQPVSPQPFVTLLPSTQPPSTQPPSTQPPGTPSPSTPSPAAQPPAAAAAPSWTASSGPAAQSTAATTPQVFHPDAAEPQPSAAQPSAPQRPAPEPVEHARPTAAWTPPEWAPRPSGAATEPGDVSAAATRPSSPRIGTLDDEVAAMLALRSDIQEQALSELSQLSAYRPRTVDRPSEQLRRRVPSTVPSAAPPAGPSGPVQRDAEELRARLSSFQSGTARGRRAAEDDVSPQDGAPS